MTSQVLAYLKAHFVDANVHKIESIQTLWSGYGEIARYAVPSLGQSIIVKIVTAPSQTQHPRGWNSARSHKRKLDSYLNEMSFYERYNQDIDSFCRIPACYFSRNLPNNEGSLLVMEDLDGAGFAHRKDTANIATVKSGVRWLAYFHAKHMQQSFDDLWPVGTYWHLATRPDEFEKMPASKLKKNAHAFDRALNNAQFQTLLHGDAKLANFCFSKGNDNLAAVDFQYVGRGAGIKDLMYFLGSCLNESELLAHADTLLNEYFEVLEQALSHYKGINPARANIDFALLEAQWRALMPFAWADFERFLVGWATQHYKMNAYTKKQTEIAIDLINDQRAKAQ